MEINSENFPIGNKAMANVLLLYFHILSEKGITNDQTVYLDTEAFDPKIFVDVVVCDSASMDINQELLREGAMIYLVCEINDVVGEYDDSFHAHPYFNEIGEILQRHCSGIYPEVSRFLACLAVKEELLDFNEYNSVLKEITRKYVFERMQNLVWKSEL